MGNLPNELPWPLVQFMFDRLLEEQEEYEEYWVKNSWGFGDRMRDYLLQGPRRIKYEY